MAFAPSGTSGVSNGTTDVVVVAAPAAPIKRIVSVITVNNTDTVSATVTVKLADGASERIMYKQDLAKDSTLEIIAPIVLRATTTQIELVLGGAVTANELQWTASWADLS